MANTKPAMISEKEVMMESTPSSRPWTASTTTTANNLEFDRIKLTAPQKATLARARSEAWRSRSQRRLSLDSRELVSRRSSCGGVSPASRTPPRFEINPPSSFSLSPCTTACTTPKILPPRPAQSSRQSRKLPRLTLQIPGSKSDSDLHADLHWQINAQNPKNWSQSKRWMHTLIPSALAWVFALGSTAMTPAHDTIMHKLHTSSTSVVLTLALYVLGLAFGPYLGTLGSGIFGRKVVYMLCVPLYAIFMLAGGLVQALPGLLICRFLAGLFCSPALYLGWLTIGDLWAPHENVLPLIVYVSSGLFGSTLGPVLGAYLIWEENWRWTQYVVLCAFAACLLPIMAMKETSKKAILRQKSGQTARAPIAGSDVRTIFLKPLRMLFTEPIVLLYSLYAAFNFGVLYAVYTAFPAVLAKAEHFNRGYQGLSFLGMSVGILAGAFVLCVYEMTIYRSRVTKYKEERATEEEKSVQTSRRVSMLNRFSFARLSQDQPRTSQAGPADGRRKSNFLQIIRRISTSGYKNLESNRRDPQRNVALAMAAAVYLNSVKANMGKHIMPERLLLLLNQNLEFAQLCVTLEGYKLKFDRVELAKTLYTALVDYSAAQVAAANNNNNNFANQDFRPVNWSPTKHRTAAEATLVSTPPPPPARRNSEPLTTIVEKRKTWVPPTNIPPPEWRLHLALPASILLPGSLFMLGWTARHNIHWLVPIVAMGLFTLSSLTTFLSTTQYVLECYGPVHSIAAIGGSMMMVFVFGFVFPLFAEPMYEGLGPGLATSVFAFVAIVLGLVPSLLYVFGTTLRRRQKFKECKE